MTLPPSIGNLFAPDAPPPAEIGIRGVRPHAVPPDNDGKKDPTSPQCSAKQCRRDAVWAVVWNNPKIHSPDREKIWSACDEHRQTLADYLTSHRMNLLRIDRLADGAAPEPT